MVDEERKTGMVSTKVSMMAPKGGGIPISEKSTNGLSSRSSASMSRMKLRKMSYGFGKIAVGIGEADKSQVAPEFKRPALMYLNTYQLNPHPNREFNVTKVIKMANYVLDQLWNDHKYDPLESPALVISIADKMMNNVRYMNFNRYRVFSVVTIGEKRAQSYNNAITFLWDHERDNYVDVQRECTTNFIQVTIFGIYLD